MISSRRLLTGLLWSVVSCCGYSQHLVTELRQADLIVVGEATSPNGRVFNLRVEETLKGVPAARLRVIASRRLSGHVFPVAGRRALWCLAPVPGTDGWQLRQRPASLITLDDGSSNMVALARELLGPGTPEVTARSLCNHALGSDARTAEEASSALLSRRDLHALVPPEDRRRLLSGLRSASGEGLRQALLGLVLEWRQPGLQGVLLETITDSGSATWARSVGRALSVLDGAGCVAALRRELAGHPGVRERSLLLSAGAATGRDDAVAALTEYVADGDLSQTALKALARNGSEAAFEVLVTLANDSPRSGALPILDVLATHPTRGSRRALARIAVEHADERVRSASRRLTRPRRRSR